jgi:hypothetical protein
MFPSDYGSCFTSLAASLKHQGVCGFRNPKAIGSQLAEQPGAFGKLLGEIRERHPRWLLIIDQLEELLAPQAPVDADAFMRFLLGAVWEEGFRVLGTLRSDFLPRLIESPLRELFPDALYPLALPGPAALTRMITGPARLAGVQVRSKDATAACRCWPRR